MAAMALPSLLLPRSTHCNELRMFSAFIHDLFTQSTPETKLESPDAADVNILCKDGQLKPALGVLQSLYNPSIQLHTDVYADVLQLCANIKALAEGKQIHSHIISSGFGQDVFLRVKLVSMYATCGNLEDAHLILSKVAEPNNFAWNSMIRGYVTHGMFSEALEIYHQMQSAGVKPDKFTFPFVLKACARLGALDQGKEIHDCIRKHGFESNIYVCNALLTMYGKCGSMEDACQVFDKMFQRNVVSWNSIIAGYAQNERANEALQLILQMQLAGLKPDTDTIAGILLACAQSSALRHGKEIHAYIIRNGFQSTVLLENTLINMYMKCRCVVFALEVFGRMSQRDVVSWTTMIAGYAQNGHANDAVKVFQQMLLVDIKPDPVTITSVLAAIACLAALQQGKEIHGYTVRRGIHANVFIGSALIDMYAKCGDIDIAIKVFYQLPERNVVSWTAMIVGYGMHGLCDDALALFSQMQQAGMKPNHITFIGILSACSHAGLVDKGWQYFDCMTKDYCIKPQIDHYACMIDLLGRAGHLDEALHFLNRMPLEPGPVVWGSILGACRIYQNVKLGKLAAEHLFDLEPNNPGNYVILSNIYTENGRWDDAVQVRASMKDRGLKKMPGCSWIEVNNRVHNFLAGEISHPQSEEIYATLESLVDQLIKEGYVPNTCFAVQDMDD